jgi:hypothetical protein
MLNPILTITITEPGGNQALVFNFAKEVEIETSRSALTNTCKITLPRKLKVLKGDINAFLKRGSKVEVELGYAPELRTEFRGYIARVGAKVPVVIECEDEMWNLKQTSFSKAWKNATLREVVSFIYRGPAKVADLQLGNFVIDRKNAAQVLESLTQYHLQAYFQQDGILRVDFAGYLSSSAPRATFDFNRNVISNDLEYVRKDDVRLRVKGISRLANGEKIEYKVGDEDGDERVLTYKNLNQEALHTIVKRDFETLKKDGYRNGFETFGIPYTEPGYLAELTDPEYPERNGSYLIEAVTIKMGTDGFRRTNKLERRIA